MKQYRAYIFDFDGVIKDSVRVKSDAFVLLYASEGEEFQKRVEEYHLAHGGISRYEKFRLWNDWLGRSTSNEAIEELAQRFAQLVIDNVVSAPDVPGALEAIARAAESSAMSFIATGTPDNEMEEILSRLKLVPSFDEVHGSSRKKPEIVRDLLGRHSLRPSDILFIGDAQTDYLASVEFNLDFYLRETDYNSKWFQEKEGVTFRSEDLLLLTTIIR